MGQIGKQICHTAALEIDNEETDIFRTEIEGQREYIGLQCLGFARACCTGDQAVRTMEFFMDIQITVLAARTAANQGAHALIRSVPSPPLQYMKIFQLLRFIHFKKAQRGRYLTADFQFPDMDIGKPLACSFQLLPGHMIGHKSMPLTPVCFHQIVKSLMVFCVFDDHFAAVGKTTGMLYHNAGSNSIPGLRLINIFGQQLPFQKIRIRYEQHIMRMHSARGILTACLNPAAQNIGQRKKDIPVFFLTGCHKPDRTIVTPGMWKPAHTLPVLFSGVFLIIDVNKFYIGIAVIGGNFGCQYMHQLNRAPAAFPSDQTDQPVLQQVKTDRYTMQHPVLFTDSSRFLCQGVIDQREAVFRDCNLNLKGLIPKSQSVIQEIPMCQIAVPESR